MVLIHGELGKREGILLDRNESTDIYLLLMKIKDTYPQDKTLEEFIRNYKMLFN